MPPWGSWKWGAATATKLLSTHRARREDEGQQIEGSFEGSLGFLAEGGAQQLSAAVDFRHHKFLGTLCILYAVPASMTKL